MLSVHGHVIERHQRLQATSKEPPTAAVSLVRTNHRVPTTLQNSLSPTFPDKMNNFP